MSLPATALLLALSGGAQAQTGEVTLEARFLEKADLPKEFDFPVLELDFRVLRLLVRNGSGEAWEVPAELLLEDPRGKPLKRVTPAEMTPRIVESKRFLASRRRSGSSSAGVITLPRHPSRPYPPPYPQRRSAGPAHVDAGAGQQVRETLQRRHLAPGRVASGETLEAFVYVRSKKDREKLEGSRVQLGTMETRSR